MHFNLHRLRLVLTFVTLTLVTSLGFQNCGKFSAVGTDGEFVSSSSTDSSFAGPLTPAVATILPSQTLQFTQDNDKKSGKFQLIAGAGFINSKTGLYTPGGNNTDAVVGRRDGEGIWSYSFIKVVSTDKPLALSPLAVLLPTKAEITLSAAGGTAPYIYSVNVESTSTIDAISGDFKAGSSEEIASVTVTDSLGKTAKTSVEVKRNRPTMKVLSAPNPLVTGMNATFVVAGGTSPYILELVSGGGSVAGQVYSPGTYTGATNFRITDANGYAVHLSTYIIPVP